MTIVANDSLTLSKVNDGVGVTSTVITYAMSTSGTQHQALDGQVAFPLS